MVTEKQLPLGEELDFAALSRLKKRLPGCRLGPDEGDSSFTLNCPSFVSFWQKRRKLSLESEEKTDTLQWAAGPRFSGRLSQERKKSKKHKYNILQYQSSSTFSAPPVLEHPDLKMSTVVINQFLIKFCLFGP